MIRSYQKTSRLDAFTAKSFLNKQNGHSWHKDQGAKGFLNWKWCPWCSFWSFVTRKSKALPSQSSARLGLSALALDAASLEHLTWDLESSLAQKVSHGCYGYLLIADFRKIQFKLALWEALAACSMLLKVIAWSTSCLISQASFEYFGMVLFKLLSKETMLVKLMRSSRKDSSGYLHSSTMAVPCFCQAWSASTSARNCLCQFLRADATALWLMSVCLDGSRSKMRCFKPASVFGHCILWCFDSQAGCDHAGQFISVTRLL